MTLQCLEDLRADCNRIANKAYYEGRYVDHADWVAEKPSGLDSDSSIGVRFKYDKILWQETICMIARFGLMTQRMR